MHLGVRDLMRLLQVSESTVWRWIRLRGLPVHRHGGNVRIHRTELLEWATANNLQVSHELFDQRTSDSEVIPSLAEALQAGGIHYRLAAASKECALRELVEILPVPASVDRELLMRLFLAREALASTGIGDGIAIPHVRNPIVLHVCRPTITLGFLANPIEFGALDGQPVDVLFSIISPTNRSHLQLLSRLSFALHDRGFRETLIGREAPERIIDELIRIEASLPGSPAQSKKEAL